MTKVEALRDYMKTIQDDWNYITPLDFYTNYYYKKKDYYLIDLRDPKEYKKNAC